jgi:N-acetylmuramoyl-L-alanine amidase
VLPPGQGYSLRKGNDPYQSFVVHTTNGAPFTKSQAELNFLVNSPNVSAHYLIGKNGTIYQILDPNSFVAWHAGEVSKPAYSNYSAIGVEVHFSPKEIEWNGYLYMGLTRLARVYSNLEFVTHRSIARPAGRKIDPSGFSNEQFDRWSKSLNKDYCLAKLTVNCNIRSNPGFGNNIIGVYPKNSIVVVEKTPTEGDSYNNSNLWYNCNWFGYVHSSLVETGEAV